MSETNLLSALRRAATNMGARLFRNQVGFYILAKGGSLSSGLAVGSSDLIGWMPVTVTKDMVGSQVAVFLSVEAKSGHGKLSTKQKDWIKMVKWFGGIAGEVRSEQDLEDLLTEWRGDR